MNSPELNLHLRGRLVAACLAGSLVLGSMVSPASSETNPIAPDQSPTSTKPGPPVRTAEQCSDSLPLGFLAGQALMVGIQAEDMSSQASLFRRYHVGGAVLMDAPADPYGSSIRRFKKAAGSLGDPVLISTDEEGGEVQRFSSLGVLPPPEQVAGSMGPKQARQLVARHGRKLKAAGVDMVLGPLADVAPQRGQGPLGDRVFSSDPRIVSAYDRAYVRGWQQAGLLPTLKHFPGLGSATGNTDYQAAVAPPLRSLKGRDFIPYKKLASSGTAVMVGNQNVPGWFKGPASLSPTVDKYLRKTLGYGNSLVVTDALNAAAITQVTTETQAVVDAIAAGNDMALIVEPSGDPASSARLIKRLETGLKSAITRGIITKQKLAESALRKFTAQHVNPCSLGQNPNNT